MKRLISSTAVMGFALAAALSYAQTPLNADPSGAGEAGTVQPPNTMTRLAAVVPAGMSPQEACGGFHSVTACATAMHAARNLDIPFAQLKFKLNAGERLSAALWELKPGADVKAEVRRAEEQARLDTHVPPG
jgi:hypothetical protein